MTDNEPHAEGLQHDLWHLMSRRSVIAGVVLAAAGGVVLASRSGAEGTVTGTGADGVVCVKDPAETAGPFPGDGTNTSAGKTVNVLTEVGVQREDIRPSFAGLAPVAEGVGLVLDLTLVDAGRGCAPLAGHAVYVWHCDAGGVYSIYGAGDRNYLRGVGITDARGKVKFITVYPACYDGRWPHVHFEVFANAEAAVSGDAALLTSQFALPEEVSREVYAADARYEASLANLGAVTLAGDFVFADNTAEQIKAQTPEMTGDPATGYVARAVIGVVG